MPELDKSSSDIKLIAIDIDGTLRTNKQEITTFTKQEMARAHAKGIHVMLCTGRALEYTKDIFEELDFDSYLITVSGGEVWSPSLELLQRKLHEPEVIKELFDYGIEIGLNVWLISTDSVYINGVHPQHEAFYNSDWLKIGFDSDDEHKLNKMKVKLATMDTIETTNSHPKNIEVNPLGVSKAGGLEYVCNLLDIKMDHVMALGDSLNDLTMIEEAGLGIAMGNAQKKIKDAADFITDTNDLDGVAKAIQKFI